MCSVRLTFAFACCSTVFGAVADLLLFDAACMVNQLKGEELANDAIADASDLRL
jgi:hypothetical protein